MPPAVSIPLPQADVGGVLGWPRGVIWTIDKMNIKKNIIDLTNSFYETLLLAISPVLSGPFGLIIRAMELGLPLPSYLRTVFFVSF